MMTPAVLSDHFGDRLCRPLTTAEAARFSKISLFSVVFSNRSGSTLLADSLYRRGLPIPPQVEILDPELIVQVAVTEQKASVTDYFVDTIFGWTDQGVCGFKAGVDQLRWLEAIGLLERFKARRLIQICRSDKVAQAVSLFIARGTGQWHHAMQARRRPDDIAYSAAGIREALATIERMDADIQSYAACMQLPIHRLDYESLVTNPQQVLDECCQFLEWDSGSARVRGNAVPPLKSQYTALNAEFAARFIREERARNQG
jgi:LPS sulfotransferase NodH